MATKSTWDRRFPEFDNLSQSEINYWAEDAEGYLNRDLYGDNYSKALLAMAAHLKKLAAMSGDPNHPGTGKVQSESTGPQSYSYDHADVGDGNSAWLNKTQYGQRVLMLQQQHQPPAGKVVF